MSSESTETAVNVRMHLSLRKHLQRRFSMHPPKSSLTLYDDEPIVVDTTGDRRSSIPRVISTRKLGVVSLQRRASELDLLSVKGLFKYTLISVRESRRTGG